MNNYPLIEFVDEEPTMTSVEIAEATGKQHKNVLQAIRKMEPAWEKTTGLKFKLSEYKDNSGRKLPMYSLTKTECLYIATKFNDEARARLILRWQQLEVQQRMGAACTAVAPVLSRRQILLYALEAEERAEHLRDTSLSLLAEKYALHAEIARLRRTIDYIVSK